MKQKLILAALAIVLGAAPALANEPTRVFLNAGNVEHLNVQNDMDIVLLQAPSDDHSIILDGRASEKLNVRLNNKTLFISERKGGKEKTIVYLYVSNLKTLTVEGNSQVKTMGSLKTGKLDVFVDGNAKVHLRTTGNVKAHSLNDSMLDVKYITNTNPVAKRGY
jgi:hypothetical protein